MIGRQALKDVQDALRRSPAVVLLGARQVGKSTLARQIAGQRPSLYIDLERGTDRARLSDPEAFLSRHLDKLVILDEIHRAPEIFALLRSLIDQARFDGRKTGLYLLLGSASLDLLKQSSESLAGRIAYVDLGPLNVMDTGAGSMERLWTRGGFPDSFLAEDDAQSHAWRADFIRTYLERDVPQFGFQVPAETLHRFWTMIAHQQGGLLNSSKLAQSLGVSAPTAIRYIDLLVDLLLVRRLQPWHTNSKKRLIKSPKVYVRDSGLVHTLLGIQTLHQLLGHPVAGGSWEGFILENLASSLRLRAGDLGFYRSSGGAEIDLVFKVDGKVAAVEVKRSTAPKLSRGFTSACEDIQPHRSYVIHPGPDRFPLGGGVEAISLPELIAEFT